MSDTLPVEGQVSPSLADYDREIRRLVPHYDEMVREALDLLESLAAPEARLVDLGTGSGRLAEALAEARPRAEVIAVDVDPKVLAAARSRLARFGARVTLVEQSFFDALPACDGVVASLSLHHVHELDQKVEVLRRIHDALRPGGVLVVLDATMSADPSLSALTFARWASSMAAHGIDAEAARRYFERWSKDERYLPLVDELEALARAGFPHPECFWRKGPMSVWGAIKRE